MQFTYSSKLSSLLGPIEEYLVSNTPVALAELQLADWAYAVFLWYNDSSIAGDLAPAFGVGTDSVRSTFIQTYSKELSTSYIWRPQQVIPSTSQGASSATAVSSRSATRPMT